MEELEGAKVGSYQRVGAPSKMENEGTSGEGTSCCEAIGGKK